MSEEFDYESYLKDNYYRSNYLIDKIFSLIYHDIIYVLGMSRESIMSIYFDDSQLIFTASSDLKLLKDTQISFDFNSFITKETYPSCNVDIIYKNSSEESFLLAAANHYTFQNEIVDDYGEIRIDFEISCLIKNLDDYFDKIKSCVAKELQQYTCDIIYKSKNLFFDIDFLIADSNISAINCMFSKEKIDFKRKALILLAENYITKYQYIKILKLIEKHKLLYES